MTILEETARRVVHNWPEGDLASAVRELDEELKDMERLREVYAEEIKNAIKDLGEGTVQIDSEPMISESDEGIWISAWIFVDTEVRE